MRPYRSKAGREAVYALLLEHAGCGPFDGCCFVFAQALKSLLGGELQVIEGRLSGLSGEPVAQHAVLRLADGRLADGSGIADSPRLVRRFIRDEGFGRLEVTGVRPYRATDLPEAIRDDVLAARLARLLAEHYLG